MNEPPITRPSLLMRIRDPQDRIAWDQFVDIYAPVIHRFAGKNGLQDADALDLTQEVLVSVNKAIGSLDYDPHKGKFRGWLYTIVRNKIRNFWRRKQSGVQGSGDTGVNELLHNQTPKDDSLNQWEQEYEQQLYHWAIEQVRGEFRETTWQAFWQTAVKGNQGKNVARDLGMSVGAVYIAKSRVVARLKEVVDTIVGE